tara:strand:+ start:9 stop:368 length:360 start_codon:yes stop_codon:yes gene_type:complete
MNLIIKFGLHIAIILATQVIDVYAQDVYVTKTGSKYHLEECRYLRQSAYYINMADAIDKGFTACSVCKPGQTELRPKSNNVFPTNEIKEATTRCLATTKSKTRCKRMTKAENGRCWQHQ